VQEQCSQLSDSDLLDAIQLLWVQGRTDRQIRSILNLDQVRWLELITLLKTTDVDPTTAQAAFQNYSHEYEKFKLRTEAKLGKLDELLDKATERHPLGDGPMDIRAARRIIRDMSKLDEQLLRASTELLAVKVRLNLVDVPSAPTPLLGSDDTIFKSTTLKEVWAQRMLNGSAKT
jgi:hypothetical protein